MPDVQPEDYPHAMLCRALREGVLQVHIVDEGGTHYMIHVPIWLCVLSGGVPIGSIRVSGVSRVDVNGCGVLPPFPPTKAATN